MRVQDEYPFDRNLRACILRVGTVAYLQGDNKHIAVTVPGGTLTDVALVESIDLTNIAGKRVAMLLDRDSALAIGLLR
jgi:hypothetical protein